MFNFNIVNMLPSAKFACLYDTIYDDNGDEYIAKLRNGKMTWVFNNNSGCSTKSNNRNRNTNGYPSDNVYNYDVGDIVYGTDGNEYIVKSIKGKKRFVIHQKIYEWSGSGVLYKTFDD